MDIKNNFIYLDNFVYMIYYRAYLKKYLIEATNTVVKQT